jgi:uncharacterized membrane protein YbhN (UPF0104 family)
MGDDASQDAPARETRAVTPLSPQLGWALAVWAAAVSGLYLAVRELGVHVVP